MLQKPNQLDREHPARPFPQAPPFGAHSLDRAAPAAPFPLSTGPCCSKRVANPRSIWWRKTKWTASILLARFRERRPLAQQGNGPRSACCALSVKHRSMLQQAGCKPAFHLVAHNQLDREHPARLYPQALAFGARAIGPRSAFFPKHRPMLQQASRMLALHLVCSKPNGPAPKSKSGDKHFSVGRRLQPAPAEGPGRVVHAKKGGPQ
jgi:hypothetical protein